MLEFAGPVSWCYLAWMVCVRWGSSVASRFSTACFRSKKLTFRFSEFLPRASNYKFELEPSRNINAVVLSDLQNFFRPHFFDRFFFLLRHALIREQEK